MTTYAFDTVYTQDVQTYIDMPLNRTKITRIMIEYIKEKAEQMKLDFYRMFPSKQYKVLDHITYLTSGTGICQIGADKIAEKLNVSIATVYKAVRSLKRTDQFIVARLANKQAGKYVFVYKNHDNFDAILRDVFHMNITAETEQECDEESNQNTGLSIGLSIGLQNSEPVEPVSAEGENSAPNSFNSFDLSSKQENIYISTDLENEVVEPTKKTTAEEREDLQQYITSKWQLFLFDMIHDHNFNQEIKDVARVLALRIEDDADRKRVNNAFQLLVKMNINMSNGACIDNVVAVFSEGLNKPLNRYKTIDTPFDEKQNLIDRINAVVTPGDKSVKKVPFYDWLNRGKKEQGKSEDATATGASSGEIDEPTTDDDFEKRKAKFLAKRKAKKEAEALLV